MAEYILNSYLNRLTDLSSKNRALYLPKSSSAGGMDLREFDFLLGEPAFDLVRKCIEGKRKIALSPDLDPRSKDANQVSQALSRMAFRDQLTQEETGEQSLYLAWLFAEGKLINGQLIRSPLLLKPVRLIRENGTWSLLTEESWQWNPAFLLAWRHATGQVLSEDFSNELLETLPKDALEFRTALAQLIPKHFAIQVQSHLLEDQLLPFPNSQISLDQERFSEGNISLKPYALLGQFAQKGSFLFSDYEELIQDHPESSLEELFQHFFLTEKKEEIIREENLFPVFPLDASQESALIKVRQGKSLVIQGPPGTGKSQLIANLVSDFIARGKKVLVVSQKRAALDVVYERLEKAGFGAFLGLVHDFRADQSALFGKVKAQIEAVEEYQQQNRGIDAIQLERELSLVSKTISRLSTKFEELRTALYDLKPAGIPIKALYLQADLNRPAVSDIELLRLDFEEARQFEQQLRVFWEYLLRFKGGFWERRISFSEVQPADFSMISGVLADLEALRKRLPSELKGPKAMPLWKAIWADPEFMEKGKRLQIVLDQLPNPEQDFGLVFQPKEQKALTKIHSFLVQSLETSKGWRMELGAEKEALNEELKVLVPLSQHFFGKLQARFSKAKYPLAFRTLSQNKLSFETQQLLDIQAECQSKIQVEAQYGDLPSSGFFKSCGQYSVDLVRLEQLLTWKKSWDAIPEIKDVAEWKRLSFLEFRTLLDQVMTWSQDLASNRGTCRLWLKEGQFLELMENGLEGVFPEKRLTWPSVFAELKGFDQFLEGWKFRELGERLSEAFADSDFDEVLGAFWNGWRLAWIGEIERQYPVLSEMGSLRLSHDIELLKSSILEKRKNAAHLALLRLREQAAEHLEYNRLGNRITYRELLHQVSKKRQKWPIRKLISELGEEVFRVLPCWLGSPETVSAVFPTDQLFDLVIFDEASQCPVERGLPAMLRGKQVVVAGDSKQLRPSDFYQVKWESEEEGVEYEAESLLELAAYFFENLQLKGHYRSADPGLIHFSNRHFYQGQLETLPDYQTILAGKSAFSWEKTEGIWENQINRIEAEAVVRKVQDIFVDFPGDSIGIVTGNYFQMELIRELLYSAGSGDGPIKVRNIENVQGDEFDQVILSLGYAANREGKLVTNFGLLGKAAAPNRLNVAITRARKRMHVISSIDPEDFRPGQLENTGLALLREFLSFVKVQHIQRSIPSPELSPKGYELDWSLKNRLLSSAGGFAEEIPSAVMDLIRVVSPADRVAVLTDDQRFFSASTAKAALAYHPILLEQKGWSWEWYWSRNRFL